MTEIRLQPPRSITGDVSVLETVLFVVVTVEAWGPILNAVAVFNAAPPLGFVLGVLHPRHPETTLCSSALHPSKRTASVLREAVLLAEAGFDSTMPGQGIAKRRVQMLRHPLGVRADTTHVCVQSMFQGGCSAESGQESCLSMGKDGECPKEMCLGMRPGEGYFARGSREGGSFEECKAVAMKVCWGMHVWSLCSMRCTV